MPAIEFGFRRGAPSASSDRRCRRQSLHSGRCRLPARANALSGNGSLHHRQRFFGFTFNSLVPSSNRLLNHVFVTLVLLLQKRRPGSEAIVAHDRFDVAIDHEIGPPAEGARLHVRHASGAPGNFRLVMILNAVVMTILSMCSGTRTPV